ncbi:NADPH-dependent FMN reductase [Chitinophagaceae bacterium MMS25-I14]
MITIISGTNRKDSMTLRVAQAYYNLLKEKAENVRLISLEDADVCTRSEELKALEQQCFIPSEKFIFIIPEYNGSFPGILKTMLDNSDIKQCWWHKKALMTGVSDGRAGNLRGMEHLTNILHYLKMNVHYNKIPISRINEEMDKDGNFINTATVAVIEQQIEEFLNY